MQKKTGCELVHRNWVKNRFFKVLVKINGLMFQKKCDNLCSKKKLVLLNT